MYGLGTQSDFLTSASHLLCTFSLFLAWNIFDIHDFPGIGSPPAIR